MNTSCINHFCIKFILDFYMGSCIIFISLASSPFQFLLMSSWTYVLPNKQIFINLFNRSIKALYNAIVSPFSAFLKSWKFQPRIFFSYSKSLKLGDNFVAVFCILSTFYISFFLCSDQITGRYSNLGWINEVFNFLIISSSRYLKAIPKFLSIWYVKVKVAWVCSCIHQWRCSPERQPGKLNPSLWCPSTAVPPQQTA